MPVRNENRTDRRQRLKEIMDVVRRYDPAKDMTPEKLCSMFEELGPTFIKLGQLLSMRSDMLPGNYCEALTKLRSNVVPMPFEQVVSLVENAYGRPLHEVFASFDEEALGSASIAQAHAAVLRTGERVVVKVQREGIHDLMSRDIMLLKQACRLLKYAPVSGLVDLNQVLDEMWLVAQEEMNFQTEAANLERFRRLNEDVVFVTSPELYRAYTTTQVLMMERIDGIAIDDHEALQNEGYDLAEIGAKLADNYVRQIMDDGFFHADPHPGNLRVRDGKIVWLDMGMMGTLSEQQRALISKAIVGIARGDINACRDAVLGLGEFREKADKRQLYRDIEELLDRYGTVDLGDMDLAQVFRDLTEVMKTNHISMPGSLTMLARGLTTVEGVVVALNPSLNVMDVVLARIGNGLLRHIDWRTVLTQDARAFYESSRKSLEIPGLLADVMSVALKGEASLGIEHHAGTDMVQFAKKITKELCVAVVCAALLICGGIMRDQPPLLGGLSLYSICCFALAAGAFAWMFWWVEHQKK